MIDNADAYIAVCEKANLPCNKMPKSKKDLTLAYEMALKEFNSPLALSPSIASLSKDPLIASSSN